MTLRRRVFLIVSGTLVFIALGPLIILMAHGYRYDFKNGHLLVTGTLVIKTEPRGAQVSLNGQSIGDTPVARRFLTPNEYLVEITKSEYHSWRKRINIFERQVTFLPDQNTKINLLLGTPQNLKSIPRVADIFSFQDLIFYVDVQGRQIFSTSFNATSPQLTSSTTSILTNPRFEDGRRIGTGAEFIISSDQGKFYLSADHKTALPRLAGIQFGNTENTVLGLNDKNQLLEITPEGSKVLLEDVRAFKRNGNQIYYLQKIPSGEFGLSRITSMDDPVLVSKTPAFENASIILSLDNQPYLLLDRELYAVKDRLEKINSQVEFAYWDSHGNFLLYGNSHESWVYEPLAYNQNQLLVRATTQTTVPLFHKAAGYTFVIEDKEIKAIETDSSGQPNIYSLLTSADPKKISLNDEGNILGLFDGNDLRLIKIR